MFVSHTHTLTLVCVLESVFPQSCSCTLFCHYTDDDDDDDDEGRQCSRLVSSVSAMSLMEL